MLVAMKPAIILTLMLIVRVDLMSGDYELQVMFHSYRNPNHRVASTNRCCDRGGPCSVENCDSFFTFCQRPTRPIGTKVMSTFNNQTTAQIACGNSSIIQTFPQMDTDNVNFSNTLFGLSNPIALSGRLWPMDGIQLYLEILDEDSGKNDLIDRFAINITVTPDSSVPLTTYHGVFNVAELDMSFRIDCSMDFVGPNCNERNTVELERTEENMNSNSSLTTSGRQMEPGISLSEVVIIIGIIGALVVLLLLAAVITAMIKKRKRSKKGAHIIELQSSCGTTQISPKDTSPSEGDEMIEPGLIRSFNESHLLIPGRHIQLVQTIGQGEFGLVYRGCLTGWQGRTTAEVVAVKTLKGCISPRNIEDMFKESEKMMQFNHANVMTLIGLCTDVGEAPYIVMPFMAYGSLLAYLKKERPHLNIAEEAGNEMIEDAQKKLLSMCLQVAKGMNYLAFQNFVHRDLAARNCMIDDNLVIKVGDFGLSENMYTTNYIRLVKEGKQPSVRLPVKWMALESLVDGIFSEKTDVWSYGITCWEIFSVGYTPYPGIHPLALVKFLQEGERLEKPMNASCTNQVYALITQCWNESPNKRPFFEDLVREVDSLLTAVSGYIKFSTFSAELLLAENI